MISTGTASAIASGSSTIGARRPGRDAPQYGQILAPDNTLRAQRRHSVSAPPSPCTKRNCESWLPHCGHLEATLEMV
jgi:hypothetical protein